MEGTLGMPCISAFAGADMWTPSREFLRFRGNSLAYSWTSSFISGCRFSNAA